MNYRVYNFVDTTATYSGDWKSSEAFSLDGEYPEDKIAGYHTLSVSGRDSLEYDITDADRPLGVDGKDYYGKGLKAREITVKFQLTASTAEDLIQAYRNLANFCKGEDRKIKFADEPNAYYKGTLEKIEAPDEGVLNYTNELTFYCTDPALISDVVTTVTATETDGSLTATVNNEGSMIAYPTFRVKHGTHDNGYIGLASADGAFEIGNIEDIDGETYQQNETLISSVSAGEHYDGTNHQNPVLITTGDTYKLFISESYNILANSSATISGNVHDGGCVKYTLPADSNGDVGAKNFYCGCGISFVATAKQDGVEMIYFTDENDKFLFGYGIHKGQVQNTTACYTNWITDGDLTTDNNHEFRNFFFDCKNNNSKNPFSMSTGWCDVRKVGDEVTFFCPPSTYDGKHGKGKYYHAHIPAIKDSKVCYAYVYIGNWGVNRPWADMRLGTHQFYMQKMNVDKWNDFPNRYAKNSEVLINSETDSVTVNGLPRNDEVITGSEFLTLPPGESKIEIATSSWCSPLPTVTVEYRERWL